MSHFKYISPETYRIYLFNLFRDEKSGNGRGGANTLKFLDYFIRCTYFTKHNIKDRLISIHTMKGHEKKWETNFVCKVVCHIYLGKNMLRENLPRELLFIMRNQKTKLVVHTESLPFGVTSGQ